MEQSKGCFIWYTLFSLFSTRYDDCHTLLALFDEVKQFEKVRKINDFGLDIIGR